MATVTYDKDVTALLVIDPYNDFISEDGKLWGRLKVVAEANSCVPHMSQVLNAARKAGLRGFHVLHRRYRPGDYETWKYIAPVQKAAWLSKSFEHRTWGGEIRSEFAPQNGRDRGPRDQSHGACNEQEETSCPAFGAARRRGPLWRSSGATSWVKRFLTPFLPGRIAYRASEDASLAVSTCAYSMAACGRMR